MSGTHVKVKTMSKKNNIKNIALTGSKARRNRLVACSDFGIFCFGKGFLY